MGIGNERDTESFATIAMKFKDKVTAPDTLRDSENKVILSWANPASIANEINLQVERNTDPQMVESLQRARDTANALRIPGLRKTIKQLDRLSAAHTLAMCLVENWTSDDKPEILEKKQEQFATTVRFIAAALGHKKSQAEIEADQDIQVE
jgi:hypothetical protein